MAVVGGLASLPGCGATDSTTASTGPAASSDPMQASLVTIARQLAASHGDPGAQGRTAVRTKVETVDRLLGKHIEPGKDDGRPVYLVWMYGNFDRDENGRPAGFLLVGAVDGMTGKLVDSTVAPGELNPDQPNPEQLGLPEISLSGSTKAPAPDEETLRELRALARRAAFGDQIDSAQVYATNEQDAESVISPGSHNGNPETPVYVITMHGLFEFRGSAPDGVTVPPGHFMALVVGLDLEGRSSSFGNTVPDVSSLG